MPTPLPWRLMKWNGSAWDNSELRKWNGSSWVTADAYFWNGSSWVLCTDRTPPTSTYTIPYVNTWHGSYADGGSYERNDGQENTRNFQGNSGADSWDIQCSTWGFDTAIHTDIDGAVAYYYARVYLDNTHAWFGSGATAVIGTTASTANPGILNANRTGLLAVAFSYGEEKWVNLGTSFCSYADDGSFYGLCLYVNSNDLVYYGYWTTTAVYEHSYEK